MIAMMQTAIIEGVKHERVAIEGVKHERVALTGKVVIPAIAGGEYYEGNYTVTPKARTAQTLQTKNKTMKENVTVLEVPFFETSNEKGTTIYIANEV